MHIVSLVYWGAKGEYGDGTKGTERWRSSARPLTPIATRPAFGKAHCRPQACCKHRGASSRPLQAQDSTTKASMHNLGTASERNPSRHPTKYYLQPKYTASCTAPPLSANNLTHNQRVPTSLPKQCRNNNLQPQQKCFISSFHMCAYKHRLLVSMYTPYYITQYSLPFAHTYNSLIQTPSQSKLTPYHITTNNLSLFHPLQIYKVAPSDYKLLYSIH